MTIKDSGERREFDTGAVRDIQKGKGRMDLLPAVAIIRLSKHFEAGADKYGEYNWQKGIPIHSFIDSAIRHLMKYLDGQDDEDHLCAAAWNCMCAMWTEEKRPDMQDIPSRMKKELVVPHKMMVEALKKSEELRERLSKIEAEHKATINSINSADYPKHGHTVAVGDAISAYNSLDHVPMTMGAASAEPLIKIGTTISCSTASHSEMPAGTLTTKPTTNAERIRAMSNKELAKLLCDTMNCNCCPFGYVEDIWGDTMCKVEGKEYEALEEWMGKTEGLEELTR